MHGSSSAPVYISPPNICLELGSFDYHRYKSSKSTRFLEARQLVEIPDFHKLRLQDYLLKHYLIENLQVGKQLINVLRVIARQTTIIQRLLCSTPCKNLLGLTIHVKSREFNESKKAWLAQEVHAFIRSTTDDKAIFVNHSGVQELKFSPTF